MNWIEHFWPSSPWKLWKALEIKSRITKGNKTFHKIFIMQSWSAVDGIYCAKGLGRDTKGLGRSLSWSYDFYSYREIDLILLFMMRIIATIYFVDIVSSLGGCKNLCISCRMGITVVLFWWLISQCVKFQLRIPCQVLHGGQVSWTVINVTLMLGQRICVVFRIYLKLLIPKLSLCKMIVCLQVYD